MNTQGGRGGGIAIINADEDERLIMPGGGSRWYIATYKDIAHSRWEIHIEIYVYRGLCRGNFVCSNLIGTRLGGGATTTLLKVKRQMTAHFPQLQPTTPSSHMALLFCNPQPPHTPFPSHPVAQILIMLVFYTFYGSISLQQHHRGNSFSRDQGAFNNL